MKITSKEIVSSWTPIHVVIELQSLRDMHIIRGILEQAKRHAMVGTEQLKYIDELLPHFTAL